MDNVLLKSTNRKTHAYPSIQERFIETGQFLNDIEIDIT